MQVVLRGVVRCPHCQHVCQRAAHLAHVMQRHQRDQLERHAFAHVVARFLLPQINQRRALVIARFAKRILQRRARVAHGVAPHTLRAMYMPKRHVVERVVYRHVHVIHAAQFDLIVGAIGRRAVRGHQLMRQHNVAFSLVNSARTQHRTQSCRVVVADFLIGEEPTHIAGLQKRQQPELHRPVLILKFHPLNFARVDRRQAHALLFQQPLRVGDALG